jgi:hypothetical protein
MNSTEIKTIIQQQLPEIIAQDPLIRDFILRTVSNYYSSKQETDSKFDRILNELQRDREEQARKWEENNRKWDENNRRLDNFIHEQNQKWEENNRKWDENNRRLDNLIHEQNQKWDANNRKWDENNRRLDNFIHEQNQKWWEEHEQNKKVLEEIKRLDRRYDSTIGALGSRWGLYSEASFRNALKGILQDSFGVQVLNLNDFDDEGIVFGRPDQVEIDVIIKNGLVIVCEIKSSLDKAGMYIFSRKVEFYQKRHQRTVNRKLVISPMVDARALPLAENLGIEVYSYAEDVTNL